MEDFISGFFMRTCEKEETGEFNTSRLHFGGGFVMKLLQQCFFTKAKHQTVVDTAVPSIGILVAVDIVESSGQITERYGFNLLNLEVDRREFRFC